MPSIYIRAVKGTGLVDRLIRARTGSPYSHVEFAYPFVGSRVYRPSWLGSQPHGGVQVRPYDYLGTVQYDLFAISVPQSTLESVRAAAGSMIGDPYSFASIFDDIAAGLARLGRRQYDCSGFVTTALARGGVHLFNGAIFGKLVTPRDVAINGKLVLMERR